MLLWLLSAWVMGFIGSTHCIGMCGPLALSLPMQSDTLWGKLFQSLTYNFGRITTYAVLGSLIGLSREWMVPFVFQNQLSMVIGGLLILLSAYFLFAGKISIEAGTQNPFYRAITRKLGQLYQQSSVRNLFFIGILNGLLPCGLVYLALATAFASASILKSSLFMAFFGLGTLPAMWSIIFFSNYITPAFRTTLRRFVPYIYAITGILLILRGLGNHNPLQGLMPNIYCHQ